MFATIQKSRRVQIGLAVAFVVMLLGGYLYWRYTPRSGTVSFQPTYELVLKDYSGTDVRLSQFKREILVVHAWATWCTYCGEELKNLAILKKKYGDNILILAPNRAESVHVAKPFTDALGLDDSITYLLDADDAFYRSISGYAMPETLFINDRGEVFFHQRGPMNIAEVEQKIAELTQ
ncbi:MAG: TlpA family protein disulfide reductase [Candidatus Pacebacteria bacterium]|nr:TlpA family protein disulfide reductase [Candidatus Paceibacterota bacterium]